ncbi:hypothetical protein J6590_050427 [Homalodisca vitripennis]|nr:hypothetical protein J6590_050427 [Homalodisca vitripennis]
MKARIQTCEQEIGPVMRSGVNGVTNSRVKVVTVLICEGSEIEQWNSSCELTGFSVISVITVLGREREGDTD